MKRITILFCFVLCLSCTEKKENPKLVIGIVVDQMKMEYLHRFYDKFSESGFKRLVEEGFLYKNAHYNYIPTKTGPGHASIYTGTTPSNHGIIANDWFARESNLMTNCVSDPSVSPLGGNKMEGMFSPKNLISSTITDEVRSFSNFRSKVVSISLKNRGAILPGGHNPNGAYWMDTPTGNFMSSSYYFDALPEWVVDFNNRKLTTEYLSKTWNTLLPIEEYTESSPDDNEYERIFKGTERPVFPYDLSEIVKSEGYELIKGTPFGNSLTLDLMLAAIEGEQLGNDAYTDFLAVSFSSTDYVGHDFGPNSIEIQDTFLRLDLEIKKLLEYLDQNFPNQYQLFLTSDHGVANVPQFQIDNKLPGGYIRSKDYKEESMTKIQQALGPGDWVLKVANNQIYLNRILIKEKGLSLRNVQEKVRDAVLSIEVIEQAYTATEIANRNGTDYYRQLLEKGYNTKRSGDVLLKISPGYISDGYSLKGTTHQSGNTYDTHVPVLFFGQNIPSGNSVRKVSVTDIAPTISMLLDISMPGNSTGNPLIEILE